jgi:hypothetical protein
MISRIFGSFELVCAEKIELGDGAADPVLAFKSKKTITPPDRPIERSVDLSLFIWRCGAPARR